MARIEKDKNNHNDEPLEKKLWKAADKLRKNMDAAEYKHIVLIPKTAFQFTGRRATRPHGAWLR